MSTRPQRILYFGATPTTLLRRPRGVNLDDVTAVLLAVVIKSGNKATPPDLHLVSHSPVSRNHPSHIEIFDEHGAVLRGVEVSEFVVEVAFLVQSRVL